MKIKYIISAFLGWSVLLTGCSDFLDKEPLAQGTTAIFYKTPEQFKQAANAFYDDVNSWRDINNTAAYYLMDQNLDISGLSTNGGGTTSDSDFNWDKPYGFIRDYNHLLTQAEAYAGNADDIKAFVGAAYFFRAWQHFFLLQRFGGVPIVTTVPGLKDPVVMAPRNSRYEVIAQVISDLEKAVENLPKETAIAVNDKGQVSKEAAKAFYARVMLYEATWEKYATLEALGYDLDGDGTTTGAGKTKPTSYPTISNMLEKAKQMSKEVIDEAVTGTFALWNECDSLSYYYLFNLDKDAKSNFKGAGKNTNKEFIFYSKWDFDLRRPNINITHTWPVNISTQLAESFLCSNGLPIRISKTANIADAENNPQFLGYAHFIDEFRNRDYRFISSTGLPDRLNWGNGQNVRGGGITDMIPYPDPEKWAVEKNIYISNPTIRGGNFSTYGSRKFRCESPNREDNYESYDFSLIRLAEVHLIYAEAVCELGNGSISDEDLNFSINKNRARARIAPLTNALIKDLYDAGWWDHKEGKTVAKKMNMLDEIRRERACELFGEGFRENDLRRWGIAHINLTGVKLGRHLYGTQYMTEIDDNPTSATVGKPCYWPEQYPLSYGVYTGSGENDPDYGRSITNLATSLKYSVKDYQAPIPLGQILLNEGLTQNPGW